MLSFSKLVVVRDGSITAVADIVAITNAALPAVSIARFTECSLLPHLVLDPHQVP